MLILCIISYFLIGFISGIVYCKIKGKEWCRANDADECVFENHAQEAIFLLTFLWGPLAACAIL